MDNTRLFYVVDAPEVNEELFTTYEKALDEYKEMVKLNLSPRIRICQVKHSYKEMGGWNYDDYSDTFETVKELING